MKPQSLKPLRFEKMYHEDELKLNNLAFFIKIKKSQVIYFEKYMPCCLLYTY